MPTTRRLNFTQRRSISGQMVEIVLHRADGDSQIATFDVHLDLSPLDLPHDAPVRVEAYRGRSAMRFDWGTVGFPAPPAVCQLDSVPFPPRFRVMVLAPDGSGRLLALGDKLTPRWQDERSSLLEVEFTDLGMEVWRLKFDEFGGGPVLEVNKDIKDVSHAVRHDQAFRSLVLPEVLRSILTRALIVDGENPDDNEEGSNWRPWMLCVRDFYHDNYPKLSADDIKDTAAIAAWIDGAVTAFTEKRFRAKAFFEATLHE